MDYDPLDERPKIQLDADEWIILGLCIFGVVFMIAQVLRWAL